MTRSQILGFMGLSSSSKSNICPKQENYNITANWSKNKKNKLLKFKDVNYLYFFDFQPFG